MGVAEVLISEMQQGATRYHSVIVGLGKTGIACARLLAREGVDFAVTDSREQPPALASLKQELPDVPLYLGCFDPALLGQAGQLLISPGVSLKEPAIQQAIARGVPALGDVELFCHHAEAPVVAVTGSNGKSTVTTLLAEMARRAGRDVRVGGNLGKPSVDLIGERPPDLYVLELSSFQLETTYSLRAAAAAVLNVTPDHMDRYADVRAYARAKERIYVGAGTLVINSDDPLVAAMGQEGREVLLFTLGEPGDSDFGVKMRGGKPWLARGSRCLMPVAELKIQGYHNVANALAALALGTAMGFPLDAMRDVLRDFQGLAHRCQWVFCSKNVNWYNDSKGTNVGATCAAIKGLSDQGRLVLIAGGDAKGADFSPLVTVAQGKLRAAVLMGRDASLIEQRLKGITHVERAKDMTDAVAKANDLAHTGDIVLLSPACASFDMYSDYAARGDAFVSSVHEVLAE